VIARFFMALVAALLLSSASVAAQAPALPPLDAAERALVKALMLPDPDAFRQLLASDAVSTLPAEAHGPDAIVEKWRPFLSSSEVRLAPIIESSTTAQSGAMAQTSGTLTIYGRTANGMRTTPAGTFAVLWRLVDGEWKIGMLTRAGQTGIKRIAD
jgi:hypothetical protein